MFTQLMAQIVYNKKVVRTTLILLLVTQNALGILNTFSTLFPVPPRTSIGLMTEIAALIIVVVSWMYIKHLSVFRRALHLVDYLLMLYIVFQALSLLVAPIVYQSTNFRILLIASIQYGCTRLIVFSSKEKKILMIGISAVALLIALASVFQVFFRDAAIALSKMLLFGDAAYGVEWELLRGRVPHWGNLTIVFPFFFSSLYFVRKKAFLSRLYLYLGLLLIPFAFIVSNFRWITTSFIIGTGTLAVLLVRYRLIESKRLLFPIIMSFVATTLGLVFVTTFFHYNIIDRLLLKDFDRDVTISTGRLYLYQQAIDVFISSPVLGIGMGNYPYFVEAIIGVGYRIPLANRFSEITRQPISSHNELLTILAEGGAVSLLLFVWMNALIINHLITFLRVTPIKYQKEKTLFSLTLIVSLLMYYFYGLFENTSQNNMVVIFFIYAASQTWLKSESIVPHFQTRK
ncbi:MAG: hypothetical protein A2057_11475 [Ignavibacteria bacterium GWA2_35_9]|nr:MAG: hypothetical protein UT26_C0007G0003 [Microgenomates group bacterium GW2011_GWC1_39_12]KKR79973.1 MAG: hypothetical protein UU25_C0004G0003 [Microgenomates group bacterium GW2011_GWB1_40_9]OGU32819.1 MAG: hypothetical protein A2057_11475 [Ignavibacteria bacterium GWA2_35_9]